MRRGDTIYALSSGALPAGVAVIRISGPDVRRALDQVCGGTPPARRATLRKVQDPETGELIDKAVVLFFEGPASFTGEDGAEIHVHGGRAVVAALLATLGRLPGLRLAEAGEFTRRAFLNGRLDLTQAEGLADLVEAETEAQRRLALRQSEGSIRARYDFWRDRLVKARALVEAELDFSEEEGVLGAAEGAWREVRALHDELTAALASASGERLRDGFEVVILGPPNAGKSSLLNVLAGREAAIVDEEEGTTRDLVEINLDLLGYPVRLVDTAGLRVANSGAEKEGVRRARLRARSADLVLWLWSDFGSVPPQVETDAEVWIVASKADLMDASALAQARTLSRHVVSAHKRAGLAELLADLGSLVQERWSGAESAVITRERHREAVRDCCDALEGVLAEPSLPSEIAAEHLRRASDALGRVTGRVDVEGLLDVIFSEFCIGK